MVKLDTIREQNGRYFSKRPITAVVVGGGSGLGAYLALELANIKTQEGASKSDLHVIIVARTVSSAQATLSELQRRCPTGQYEVIYCKDLALLAQVRETVDRIKTVLQNWQNRGEEDIELDYLFMTQGQVEFSNAPIMTPEGLDKSMSLLLYSRLQLIKLLTPILERGTQPSVVSIYAAGTEGKLDLDDLGLRKSYSFADCRSHVVHLKAVAFAELARRHAPIAFVHYYPRIVITPGYSKTTNPLWFKAAYKTLGPLLKSTLALSQAESSARMANLARHESFQPRSSVEDLRWACGGSWSVNWDNEVIRLGPRYKPLREKGLDERVMEHFREIWPGEGL